MAKGWYEYLAFLSSGARDKSDSRAPSTVSGHSCPIVDRLIIGVGMDQQETAGW